MVGLYLLGIIFGILAAFLYKNTVFTGEPVPFVMELPNYRMPSMKNTVQLLWEKSKDFLQKAFSVILVATVIVWLLQSFDMYFDPVDNPSESILAKFSGLLVPVMAPVGLGDWRILVSLISGIMAKESVVSTLKILYGGGAAAMSSLSAACLLVFSLLYTPCIAAITAVKRELGTKWAVILAVWQSAVAWGAALIVHLIGVMTGAG